ncbi:MAG: hypothetical protein P0S96_01905 [Simkaniaceae bacterium]|nr:hypothetical protein [Candidatus Sacchlamyda saccharinae]
MAAISLLGSYPCYAGGTRVRNPELQREIRFISDSDVVRVEYGKVKDGSWTLHNVIENIQVERKSLAEIATAMGKASAKAETSPVNFAQALGESDSFSSLEIETQRRIAENIHDSKLWDVEVYWFRDGDGHIATSDRVDTVARLVLQPVGNSN